MGLNEKTRLNFRQFSLKKNRILLKEWPACNSCLEFFYLPKLKRGLRLAFGVYCHIWKCSLFNTPWVNKSSMLYLFSFSRYQIKCVIKFLFRQLMTLKTFNICLQSSFKAIANMEKREENRNTKNLNSSKMKRAFLMK